ncbi:hypothetical protein [Streptomyces sp. Ag109_G2-15]|uniref:hypothetical protein n=1 Tax=Streptomyces sp. Ag109_G2-15 TaxID=1938850 RepID=UPI000BCD9596|nr:hypothetical protein [Streptomyces sp. Ag109_G2-15]SOD90563.1 hypothetical protein SAMN06272765_6522 [Streptomyces sp. Ag109_G2-15]
MTPSPDDFDQTFSPAHSPQRRDRGLRRARRLTRWIAVAAVAGAAALGSLYTHLVPGSSAAPAPTSPPVQNQAASAPTTAGDDDEGAAPATQPAPQPPAQPPTATQQKPHTTTGAS